MSRNVTRHYAQATTSHQAATPPFSAADTRDGRETPNRDGGRSSRRTLFAHYCDRLEERVVNQHALADAAKVALDGISAAHPDYETRLVSWVAADSRANALAIVLDELRWRIDLEADTCGAAQEPDGRAAIPPVRKSFLQKTPK